MTDLTNIHGLKANVEICLDDINNVKDSLDELFEARSLNDQEVADKLANASNKHSETLQSVAQLKPQITNVLTLVKESLKVLFFFIRTSKKGLRLSCS